MSRFEEELNCLSEDKKFASLLRRKKLTWDDLIRDESYEELKKILSAPEFLHFLKENEYSELYKTCRPKTGQDYFAGFLYFLADLASCAIVLCFGYAAYIYITTNSLADADMDTTITYGMVATYGYISIGLCLLFYVLYYLVKRK